MPHPPPEPVLRLLPPACAAVQLTYLLDDPGVFANWRSMEGHSVNTYTMINADGKESYVKFIWMPKGGEGRDRPCACPLPRLHSVLAGPGRWPADSDAAASGCLLSLTMPSLGQRSELVEQLLTPPASEVPSLCTDIKVHQPPRLYPGWNESHLPLRLAVGSPSPRPPVPV
jgi:hypothetical protein